jgi:hypothetical protein
MLSCGMATGTTSSTLLIVIVLIHGTVAVTALFLGVTEVAVAALAGISVSAAQTPFLRSAAGSAIFRA